MVSIFGCTNLQLGVSEVPAAVLDGRYILLYFTANWCPPGLVFTPMLREFLGRLKGHRPDVAAAIAVVFMSSDKSLAEFEYVYEDMVGWYALPYRERKAKLRLSERFAIDKIPAVVVITPDGRVATVDGCAKVVGDAYGTHFPWLTDAGPSQEAVAANTCCTVQ
jgi:nucleoredoxin